MKQRIPWYAWGFCVLLLGCLIEFPLRTGKIRIILVAAIALVWLGLLALLWWQRYRKAAIALLIGSAGLSAWITLGPGSPPSPAGLRDFYLSRLKRYNGTPYIWGGENSLGIDCSGLVRQAFVDALFLDGLRHGNPAVIRDALWLWCHDLSAMGLGTGEYGATISVAAIPSKDRGTTLLVHHEAARPGDLAVTASGSHVLAYLGGEEWIEADPSVGKTHIFKLDGPFHGVGQERVRFVRWKWLGEP